MKERLNKCKKCGYSFPDDILLRIGNKLEIICEKCGTLFTLEGNVVFLSGTSEFELLMENLYEKLTNLGYSPIWYKEKLIAESNNNLKDCFDSIKIADRFILVIGKEYGSPYKNTDHSITEEEFRRACKYNKIILAFIKSEILFEFHNLNNLLITKANKKVHDFIRRVFKKKRWLIKFDFAADIIKEIKNRWELPPNIGKENSITSEKVEVLSSTDVYNENYLIYLLKQYHQQKSEKFIEEEWPYDIDENQFVNIFDLNYGSVTSRTNQSSNINCLSFINDKILNGPIICVGQYGMGKTTISKMFFKKWIHFDELIFPVYINLTHRSINEFYGDNFTTKIVSEIKKLIFEKNLNHEIFRKEVFRFIKNKKLLIILDGIDESRCERNELLDFLNFIFENNFYVFFTCRLEYHPFFDIYQALRIEKAHHLCIELCEWKNTQWEIYIEGLKSNYPEKIELITSFKKQLIGGIFSTLPSRPLFLKMLSDLIINNETNILINPELSSNLAEIYYKFIKWKTRDDYNRKGGLYHFDLEEFEKECFLLLREIAFLEYKSENEIALESILNICHEKNIFHLSKEYISSILLESSIFSIVRRTQNVRFAFSHKSFMEYLMAFNLANCIFPQDINPNNAICGEIWYHFQTYEIAHHFQNEIERIQITHKLKIEERNIFLFNAFKKVLDNRIEEDLLSHDKRFEEVLYYIGKFNIRDPELISILKQIVKNNEKYHANYFRTASVALAMVIDKKYCERYVFYLIEDYMREGDDFELNLHRQKRYYGETTLHKILKNDIDDYIFGRKLSPIISLKIFTYFTTKPTEPKNFPHMKNYLNQVYNAAIEQGHSNIQKLCKEIPRMKTQNILST